MAIERHWNESWNKMENTITDKDVKELHDILNASLAHTYGIGQGDILDKMRKWAENCEQVINEKECE